VNFDMPEIKTPSDALVAATAIMRAVAGGDLTPSEAAELSKTIDSFVRVAETADLAERIKRAFGAGIANEGAKARAR
jgi:hypothetical protein